MPAPKQQNVSLEALNQKIYKHMKERDWDQNPSRSLAISISLEANELLEHYQWQDTSVGDTDAIGQELADIFIYSIQFAQRNNIDIAAMIDKKLEKSAKKYPAENFKGKDAATRSAVWAENKIAYRKEGL